jgi:murein DD-endopeptidase MepM/ murein hydrolase activator NlpD
MRASRTLAIIAAALSALTAPSATLLAQSALKYRDVNGQWIFTDQSSSATAHDGESLKLGGREPAAQHIGVERADTAGFTQLIATNGCLCVVMVRLTVEESDLPAVARGAVYNATLEPGEQRTLLHAPRDDGSKHTLRYHWSTSLGSPQALHAPGVPYRAPFALGATFMVSQAYPTAVTHQTPDSRYAVDIALPDGTPVYAARGGIVIDVRHDSFLGAIDSALLDRANEVEILHEDGTIAVYAHLHWDSIRVRIGQHVVRGEYIANSGNTGFTSGPHLHFAVWRNANGTDIAVPVQFSGPGGVPVTPTTGEPLTAY